MPGPLRSKEPQKTKLLSIEKELPIQQWQEELEYLRQEVIFFQELLQIGLQSGSGQTRLQLRSMLDQLTALAGSLLPEMFVLLKNMVGNAEVSNEITRTFFLKQEALKQDFRELKTRIFLIVDEFQSITIW